MGAARLSSERSCPLAVGSKQAFQVRVGEKPVISHRNDMGREAAVFLSTSISLRPLPLTSGCAGSLRVPELGER